MADGSTTDVNRATIKRPAAGLEQALTSIQRELLEDARQHFAPGVIRHWLEPHNPGVLANADAQAWVQGSCNDTLGIFLRVEDERVVEASFVTDGCGASIAVGSVAATLAEQKTLAEARAITAEQITGELGGLPPDHAHCAELAAETLRAALDNYQGEQLAASAQRTGERR